ncbi:hypothetical protein A8926_4856 [Saccharopolyspora spinosa]|uniref:Uncharacterized protein n=1 Tax=Saccharopolyspora spinosa TaxID=60894 RepID=A0A2N3Y224_SACSN|nr:hypothetical protein A8926_4856 [Saccharopolyspora spinosa]
MRVLQPLVGPSDRPCDDRTANLGMELGSSYAVFRRDFAHGGSIVPESPTIEVDMPLFNDHRQPDNAARPRSPASGARTRSDLGGSRMLGDPCSDLGAGRTAELGEYVFDVAFRHAQRDHQLGRDPLRLADTTYAGEHREPRAGHHRLRFGQFTTPSDEAGRVNGNVSRRRSRHVRPRSAKITACRVASPDGVARAFPAAYATDFANSTTRRAAVDSSRARAGRRQNLSTGA